MSSITKYYCDQCKQEVKSDRNLYHVTIKLEYASQDFPNTHQFFAMCEKCCSELGFIKRVVDEKKQMLTVEPTEADKLYDIVLNMVRDNMQ